MPDWIRKRRIRHGRARSVPEAENKLFEIVLTGTATRTTTENKVTFDEGILTQEHWPAWNKWLSHCWWPQWVTWANLTTIRFVYVSCKLEGRRNRHRRGQRLWDWFWKRNVRCLTGTPDHVKYSEARMRYWNGQKFQKRPSALRKLWRIFSLRTHTIGGRNTKTRNLWLDPHQCRTAQAVIVRHLPRNSWRKRKSRALKKE